MRLATAGLALGVLAALGVGRLLESQLVGVSGADPLTFGAVIVVLGLIASLATALPARRAAGVDPMVALRHE